VARRERRHARKLLHGGDPMYVAIAHQREMRIDAFRREGFR